MGVTVTVTASATPNLTDRYQMVLPVDRGTCVCVNNLPKVVT